jgi:short-subunit dehydrogenase
MGRALARLMAERGDALFLLGRASADLENGARDLEVRSGRGPVGFKECDLEQPATFAPALEAAEEALAGLDAVVVTAGRFGTQAELETNPALLASVLNANFTGTVLFCEFSSVAGERGRKPTVLYGSTKAGLSRYLEGLDHRFHASGLRVISVKPGFVKTSMTAGLPAPPFSGSPEGVAAAVLRAIDRNTPVVYAPSIWRWIMTIIRLLPRFIMRKINF